MSIDKSQIVVSSPGSYLCTHIEPVLQATSYKLQTRKDKLAAHPDFYLLRETMSIGIDVIREVGHFLRIKPIASAHKILVIENFHLATNEAQNAFLKTFEEPPEYAYIFLITPYIDRLLKTIVSRAQVIESSKFKVQSALTSAFERSESAAKPRSESEALYYGAKAESQSSKLQFKIQNLLNMSVGERFLWLEKEIKGLEDKIQVKLKFLEIIDEFLIQGVKLLQEKKMGIDALEYLKEAKWKIEQGFPNPKLLIEGFLIELE